MGSHTHTLSLSLSLSLSLARTPQSLRVFFHLGLCDPRRPHLVLIASQVPDPGCLPLSWAGFGALLSTSGAFTLQTGLFSHHLVIRVNHRQISLELLTASLPRRHICLSSAQLQGREKAGGRTKGLSHLPLRGQRSRTKNSRRSVFLMLYITTP